MVETSAGLVEVASGMVELPAGLVEISSSLGEVHRLLVELTHSFVNLGKDQHFFVLTQSTFIWTKSIHNSLQAKRLEIIHIFSFCLLGENAFL